MDLMGIEWWFWWFVIMSRGNMMSNLSFGSTVCLAKPYIFGEQLKWIQTKDLNSSFGLGVEHDPVIATPEKTLILNIRV